MVRTSLLLTDGTINKTTKSYLGFSNKEDVLIDDFQNLTKTLFDKNAKLVRVQKNGVKELKNI